MSNQKHCVNFGEFGHFKASKLCPAVDGASHQQKGASHSVARGYGRVPGDRGSDRGYRIVGVNDVSNTRKPRKT
ncbi:hypothetical protein DPMN_013994 [Dreissena polymorpha]|uniref:Uncharacterized protein n=1 Tax=Dreissena polymorpha TaxID=45954 RepID=A0A9D4N570_DREPO|nr:hypothetical protein DPMN_013994 [Dreissena polymorpha]